MPNLIERLSSFLNALGADAEPWGKSGLRVLRKVTGDTITLLFRVTEAPGPTIPRADVQCFDALEDPRAVRRLITAFTPSEGLVTRLAQKGVLVTSLEGYFNETVRSQELTQGAIAAADDYIPETRYVPQRVEGADTTAMEYVLQGWLPRDPSEATTLLVVLAPAGHGKTCLAHCLTRQLSREHQRDSSKPVPVLMPLHLHRHIREFPEMILTHLENLEVYGFTSTAFAHLANEGRIIPVLDGFDELVETGGLKVARQTLRFLMSGFGGKARVILTSRQAFFRHRGDIDGGAPQNDDFRTIELLPFDDTERKAFFVKQGVTQSDLPLHEELIRKLGDDREVLGSPLMLWTVVEAVKKLPQGRLETDLTGAELFGQCLSYLARRETGRQPRPLSEQDQVSSMAFLAEAMFDEGSYALDDAEGWLEILAEQHVPRGLPDDDREAEEERLIQMFRNHASLQVQGGVGASSLKIQFVHSAFRDYLLAKTIADAVKTGKPDRLGSIMRKALPYTTVRFLSELVPAAEFGDLALRIPGGSWFRSLVEITLLKCDAASDENIEARSVPFAQAIPKGSVIRNQDLSSLNFRSLIVAGLSFEGTDLSNSVFHNCQLIECDFRHAMVHSARFYGCLADRQTADTLRSAGVDPKTLGPLEEAGQRVQVLDDPVIYLVSCLFKRFVTEPGKHQRTKLVSSCYRGLGAQEQAFTRREIIPEIVRAGAARIPKTRGSMDPILEFDSQWQHDADALIFDEAPTERVQALIERLRKASGRYDLY